MNKKAFVFLVLFVVSFFVSLFLNFKKINVPYFNGLYKKVSIDIIFKNNNPPKVFYDDVEIKNYKKIDNGHYLFEDNKFYLVKKIKFSNYLDIEQFAIFIENDSKFYNKAQETIEIDNNKSIIDKFTIIFLSFIYNPWFYIIPYVFFFLFLYNFEFNYKTKWFIISAFIFGFIFRISQLNSIPFWDDEIYILTHSNHWLETIQDPGNPPLYFALFKIYRYFVDKPEFYRISSVIIGLVFNYCFYLYIKEKLGSKTALIGLLIVSVNIILIYFSQELRCYMLLMLLAVINSHFLFKFNLKTKNYYLISSIALLYTHYYASFFVLYNFIVGFILFFKNKIKLKNFVLVNIFSFLNFISFIFYKKENLVNDFNAWIKPPSYHLFLDACEIFAGKILFCVLFLILCILVYKKLNKKREKLFFYYNFFAIIFVFICASVFSYLIKPIFCYRYFYVVYPSYLALVTFIVCFDFKTKYRAILGYLIFILLTISSRLNYQNLYCNHNIYLDFVRFDKTDKKRYVFVTDTIEGYEKFKVDNAEMIYLQVNTGMAEADIEKYDYEKDSIIYVHNLYLADGIYKKAKKITLYKTPLGVFCRIEI